MNTSPAFDIVEGFAWDQNAKAAELFWDAFKGMLSPVMNPEEKALKFLEAAVDPSHSIGAISEDGALIGIAGFKTRQGSFISGGLKELQVAYGWFGGIWRGLILSLLEREQREDTLTMDGIVVSSSARGQSVGATLLTAIKFKAAELGCRRVRLDVIDTNPRARALYERQGFIAEETSDIGPLRHVFGFRNSTTMICKL